MKIWTRNSNSRRKFNVLKQLILSPKSEDLVTMSMYATKNLLKVFCAPKAPYYPLFCCYVYHLKGLKDFSFFNTCSKLWSMWFDDHSRIIDWTLNYFLRIFESTWRKMKSKNLFCKVFRIRKFLKMNFSKVKFS